MKSLLSKQKSGALCPLSQSDEAHDNFMITGNVPCGHFTHEPGGTSVYARGATIMAPKSSFKPVPATCCKTPRRELLISGEHIHPKTSTDR